MQGILAERSLCPHVIATTEEIIVTEHISGKVLSEQDMLDNSELMDRSLTCKYLQANIEVRLIDPKDKQIACSRSTQWFTMHSFLTSFLTK